MNLNIAFKHSLCRLIMVVIYLKKNYLPFKNCKFCSHTLLLLKLLAVEHVHPTENATLINSVAISLDRN